MQGGAKSWQSVQFVKRVYITEIMSAILIEEATQFGTLMLRALSARLTAELEECMSAPAA